MQADPARPGGDVRAASAWLVRWRTRQWARWRLQVVAEAGVWATAVALAVFAFTSSGLASAAGALAAGLWRMLGGGLVQDVRAMLRAVEAAQPSLGNALMAWHDVEEGTLAPPAAFRQRLAEQAHAALRGASPPAPRPARHWAMATTAAGVALLIAWLAPSLRVRPDALVSAPAAPASEPSATLPVPSISLVVTPPAYTGRPPLAIDNVPPVVEVLIGSSIRARYAGLPRDAALRFGVRTLPLTFQSNATIGAAAEASFEVQASGILTLQAATGQTLRTTAIRALPDAAPVVRIEQPGHDLRLPDAARTVPVVITATDDIGLRVLRLRYTKVSGSGESFEFTDGELPVDLRRASHLSWQGRATFDLTALAMGAGDSLVYHAVARDGRLDAGGLAESERYLIEIPRPGAVAGGDFSLPEPEQRYALSQRMIIQLTEHLLERRPRLDAAGYSREAQSLAVQQRRVRAEFVFLMGGEVVDEVEEAAHAHEVEAGRMDNRGQRELLEAVRQMAQAEQRLADASLVEALPYEYAALQALQAAFGKARYFMRTLPTRVAIDLTRRGSGDLDLADPSASQRAPLPPDALGRARQALTRLATLSPASAVNDVAAMADDLVALDADGQWLGVVQGLTDAFARPGAPEVKAAAIGAAADALRARLLRASPASLVLPLRRGTDEAGLARAAGPAR